MINSKTILVISYKRLVILFGEVATWCQDGNLLILCILAKHGYSWPEQKLAVLANGVDKFDMYFCHDSNWATVAPAR